MRICEIRGSKSSSALTTDNGPPDLEWPRGLRLVHATRTATVFTATVYTATRDRANVIICRFSLGLDCDAF